MKEPRRYAAVVADGAPIWSVVKEDPKQLSWLEQMLRDIAPRLELAEGAALCPPEVIVGGSHASNYISRITQTANEIADLLESITTAKEAQEKQQRLHEAHNRLRQEGEQTRQWTPVWLVFKMRSDIQEARHFIDATEALNARLDVFSKKLQGIDEAFRQDSASAIQKVEEGAESTVKKMEVTATEVEGRVKGFLEETSNAFKATLKEAGELKERTKQTFEESLVYFQNEAMTAFGKAFDVEATLAEKKAFWAGWKAFVWAISLVLFVFGLVAIEILRNSKIIDLGDMQLTTMPEVWRWAILRISAVAFLGWFVGHYFRERKNFLHVAVANRHRRNLCNAYIAVSEKMTDLAREQYLSHILPELSVLGKTGFITKEEIPDTPTGNLIKKCLDLVRPSGTSPE